VAAVAKKSVLQQAPIKAPGSAVATGPPGAQSARGGARMERPPALSSQDFRQAHQQQPQQQQQGSEAGSPMLELLSPTTPPGAAGSGASGGSGGPRRRRYVGLPREAAPPLQQGVVILSVDASLRDVSEVYSSSSSADGSPEDLDGSLAPAQHLVVSIGDRGGSGSGSVARSRFGSRGGRPAGAEEEKHVSFCGDRGVEVVQFSVEEYAPVTQRAPRRDFGGALACAGGGSTAAFTSSPSRRAAPVNHADGWQQLGGSNSARPIG